MKGIFSKHVGKGTEVLIDGEKFILKPLNLEKLPLIFKVMKAFSGADKKDATTEDMLSNMDEEGLSSIKELIYLTLKKSYPDEPEEDMKEFGLKYMSILLSKIFEINSYVDPEQKRKQELLNKLKNK